MTAHDKRTSGKTATELAHQDDGDDDDDDQQEKGKENELRKEQGSKVAADEFCFECKRSLAKSRELINVTGQPRRRWHPECFKCMICREPMDKRQSCHVYKDQIVCRDDYLRLKRDNSIKCTRCHWPIAASDWVRKAAEYVYHLACFNCDICFRQLNTGEQFIINALPARGRCGDSPRTSTGPHSQEAPKVRLLCRLHFVIDQEPAEPHKIRSQELASGGAPELTTQDDSSGSRMDHFNKHNKLKHRHNQINKAATSTSTSSLAITNDQPCNPLLSLGIKDLPMTAGPSSGATSSGAPALPLSDEIYISQQQAHLHHQQQQQQQSSSASTTPSSNATLGCPSGGPLTPTGCGSSLQSKSKRVRTTFTEDQLSILQTHFQIDSNPDGQDLERIATITGLSKRVTQVWFQNSRARQKKYMIKRKPGSVSHGSAASLSSLAGVHNQHHHVAMMAQAQLRSPPSMDLCQTPGLSTANESPECSGQAFDFACHNQRLPLYLEPDGERSMGRSGADDKKGDETNKEESDEDYELDEEMSELASEDDDDDPVEATDKQTNQSV